MLFSKAVNACIGADYTKGKIVLQTHIPDPTGVEAICAQPPITLGNTVPVLTTNAGVGITFMSSLADIRTQDANRAAAATVTTTTAVDNTVPPTGTAYGG